MFNSGNGQHQRFSVFLQSEWMIWSEMIGLLNRIPLKQVSDEKRGNLLSALFSLDLMFYEVELRGFLPFKGAYDSRKLLRSFILRNSKQSNYQEPYGM